MREDKTRERVMYTTMSWEAAVHDVGQHILCANVVDNTGYDVTLIFFLCFFLSFITIIIYNDNNNYYNCYYHYYYFFYYYYY